MCINTKSMFYFLFWVVFFCCLDYKYKNGAVPLRETKTFRHFLCASVSMAFNRTGENDGDVLKGIF